MTLKLKMQLTTQMNKTFLNSVSCTAQFIFDVLDTENAFIIHNAELVYFTTLDKFNRPELKPIEIIKVLLKIAPTPQDLLFVVNSLSMKMRTREEICLSERLTKIIHSNMKIEMNSDLEILKKDFEDL